MIGYVYLMINPAFPNLVKIGRTRKSSEVRALELSTTGTPDRFVVVFDVLVDDCVEIESEMHSLFSSLRYADNREFFEVSIKIAIQTLQNISKNREIEEDQLINGGANHMTDWQVDTIRYYIYLAVLGEQYSTKYKDILPKGRFFRIGIVTRDVDIDDFDEESYEVSVKRDLRRDLLEYYSNFDWVEVGDFRMKVTPEIPIEIKWFFYVFDVGRAQRGGVEAIIKGVILRNIQSDKELGWRQVFDAQSFIPIPIELDAAYADTIFVQAEEALRDYYSELKGIDEGARREASLRVALSKKGNF